MGVQPQPVGLRGGLWGKAPWRCGELLGRPPCLDKSVAPQGLVLEALGLASMPCSHCAKQQEAAVEWEQCRKRDLSVLQEGDAVLWVRLPRAPTNPTISPSRAMGTDRRRSVPAALGGCQSLLGKERGKSCSPSRNGRSSQQKPPAIPNVWGDPNGNVGWWGWGVTQ